MTASRDVTSERHVIATREASSRVEEDGFGACATDSFGSLTLKTPIGRARRARFDCLAL